MIQSHFSAAVVFALATSIVFAITSKDNDRERFLYGLWTFGVFMVITLAMGWVMSLAQH
jgi:hypothetical protein